MNPIIRLSPSLLVALALTGVACGGSGESVPSGGSGGTAGSSGASAGNGGSTGGTVAVGSGGASAGSGGSGGSSAGSGGSSAGNGGSSAGSGGTTSGGSGGAAGNGGSSAGNGGSAGTGTTGGGAGAGGSSVVSDAGREGSAGAGGASAGDGGPPASVREVWVAPDGKDTNPGTVDAPMQTVCDTTAKVGACYRICPSSYSCPASGGTIWMKGGTYKITTKIDIGATRPGVAGGVMNLFAVAGEKPIIDATALDRTVVTKTGIGIHLKASYWHIKGLEVMNAPHNCIKIEGGYNVVENTVVHHCANTGITIGQYSGVDMSAGPGSNNTVLNCDSYGNVGLNNRGEDADGFGAKEQAGKNNLFKGCRSWNNADDGYDFYGWADPIAVQDCWSFENATMMAPGGDGNGFKLGKGPGGHTVTNAISAYNVATGYTSNGAAKLSTCVNCKACSNGSVTGSGDHGISGTVTTLTPCVDVKKAEGPRKADGSLPAL